MNLLNFRVAIRKRLLRILKKAERAFYFVFDVHHYMQRGHRFKASIKLARDTLYH